MTPQARRQFAEGLMSQEPNDRYRFTEWDPEQRIAVAMFDTDRLDAQILAHFGEAVRPDVRPLRDADTQALAALLARRRQVSAMLTAEKNRLSRAPVEVRPRIQDHISWLVQDLNDLDIGPGGNIRQSQYGGGWTTCCARFPE